MSVYKGKTFLITGANGPTLLSVNDTNAKREWLFKTAHDEFQDYVIAPKPGYRTIVITDKGQRIGSLLYRLLDDQKTIYLAQFFIVPEFQDKGIGPHVLKTIMPNQHPTFKRFEVLLRHQNDSGWLLYKDAGFEFGDIHLVEKYDYDPLRYMSFFKNL